MRYEDIVALADQLSRGEITTEDYIRASHEYAKNAEVAELAALWRRVLGGPPEHATTKPRRGWFPTLRRRR